MGKRIAPEQQAVTAGRKRKRVCNDFQQQDTTKSEQVKWAGDSSSSPKPSPPQTPTETKNKQLAILNASFDDNSPQPVYHLRQSMVSGIVLKDLTAKKWRLGKPIGKGNFGEIFLASDNVSVPVTSENAEYVVKIEPHSNGPLFVEIHCLLNTAKKNDENPLPPGMPEYIASGSHYFGDNRYRFLVIKRFDRDLHSLIKNRRITQKSVLTLALQILDVLQHLHDKGYCHNDIKAQNLMISKCTYRKSHLIYGRINMDEENGKKGKGNVKNYSGSEYSDNDSGNSSDDEDFDEVKKEEDEEKDEDEDEYEEDEDEDDDDEDEDEEKEEEDDDDEESKDSDMYKTPVNKKNRIKPTIQYSGSNPVRSCRRDKRNSIYDEMVKSHYLRPAKRICYSEFFNEDNSKDDTDVEKTTVLRKVRNSARKSGLSSKNKSHITVASDDEDEDDDDKSVADDDELITEERVCLIDFGLASKFMDNGVHRPFVMDQRRAHDGTLEFTSRDAHMGAHSRRSDLECLGYNLVYWSQGYLPWRDAAAQHQNEKVHWVKEYLMKDVKEMLKHVYGKQVPKYLGEYLEYIGQLAYHERPDYDKCRRIFLREYVSLGYKANDIHLSTEEMLKTSVKVKEEIENNNVIETKNIKSIMKNLNVIMPFHESTLSNRVSPKNLRSKSAKKKSSRKKFSWTEILSQDPDQIARDRAEKEFDRDPIIETPLIRYEGKPTYAILEIQNRLKFKDRIAAFAADGDHSEDEEPPVTQNKAYSMKKRNTLPVISELAPTRNSVNCNGSSNNKAAGGGAGAPPPSSSRSTRTKAGLKTSNTIPLVANTTSTKRATESNSNAATHLTTKNTTIITDNKKQRRTRRCLIKTGSTGDFTTTDESSCSSINSNSISISTNHQNAVVKIKDIEKSGLTRLKNSRRRKVVNRSDRCSSTDRSSNNSSNVNSDDDTSNFSDHVTLFSLRKKPRATKKQHNNKMLHSAKTSSSSSPTLLENNEDVVGAKRRKRSIPKKRKSSTKDDCSEGEGVGECELDERDLRTFKKRACRG